jgi:hypothetical protein
MGRIYECPICKKKYNALQPMIDCAKKCEAQEQEAEAKRLKQEAQEQLTKQTYADVQRVYKELCNKVTAYNRLIAGTNKTALTATLTSEDYNRQCKCGAKTSTIKNNKDVEKTETPKKATAKQEQDNQKVIRTDINKLEEELLKDEDISKLIETLAGFFI